MHSVTFCPVISRWTPPGWLPSCSCTSKKARTSACDRWKSSWLVHHSSWRSHAHFFFATGGYSKEVMHIKEAWLSYDVQWSPPSLVWNKKNRAGSVSLSIHYVGITIIEQVPQSMNFEKPFFFHFNIGRYLNQSSIFGLILPKIHTIWCLNISHFPR
jgi:hypothetical protein